VNDILKERRVDADVELGNAVRGMLLLDGRLNPDETGFRSDVYDRIDEYLGKTASRAQPTPEVWEAVARIMAVIRGNADIYYQEYAYVGRYVLENYRVADDRRIDFQSPTFRTSIEIGIDRYVSGMPAFESLDLPDLTGESGADVEIEPDNIRAVGLIYAAHQLEQVRLFDVVDRITETFMNGMLPVKYDAGGQALDKYYWDSEDLMTASQRHMQFSRVLGATGGDVSHEVQPNNEFDGLWLRFLSALSEYSRQERAADLLGGNQTRALGLTEEYVRKAGRDLAANASLYGWGYTHFAARRLNNHIHRAWGILRLPEIQRAYGVTNSWQVIERVAATEFGQAPNIVRFRTMANAGQDIFSIIATHSGAWTNSKKSLFEKEPNALVNALAAAAGGQPPRARRGQGQDFDIPLDEKLSLLRNAEHWLAVNGIKDAQVDEYSEPVVSAIAPSIPSYGNGSNGHGGDIADQLRQMVAAGQAPTLEQLQRLLPINVGG
jgi:hypothetical protein